MFLRFVAAWLVIIAVASYDAYLTVEHYSVMADVELNPVGRLLLRHERGVSVMIGLKTAGIGIALLFCFSLWLREGTRSKVLIASYSIAALAVGMMLVMHDDAARDRILIENQACSARSNSPAIQRTRRPLVLYENESPIKSNHVSRANALDRSGTPFR